MIESSKETEGGMTFALDSHMVDLEHLGWMVKGVARETRGPGPAVTFTINGHACAVRYANKAYKLSRRSEKLYARFQIRQKMLRDVQFLIFCVSVDGYPESFFIVPSSVIKTALSTSKEKTREVLNIPLDSFLWKGSRPRIEFWEYKDAWHYLR